MLSVGFPIDAKVGVFAMGKQYYCIPVRMLAPEALMTSTRGCVSGRVPHSSLVLADWGSSTAAGFPPLFRVRLSNPNDLHSTTSSPRHPMSQTLGAHHER